MVAGAWLKVKCKVDDKGRSVARTIRHASARPRFEVEGEIVEISDETASIVIGALSLGLERGSDIEFLPRDKSERYEAEGSPLALFQQDEQKGVPFTIQAREDLFFGGQVELDSDYRRDFDLDIHRDRDRDKFSEQVKGDMLWGFDSEGSFVLFEAAARRQDDLTENRDNVHDDSFLITRAYAYWKVSDDLRLQIGRQDFDEEREWLYDERLDGVRVHYLRESFEVEASVSAGRDILERRNPEDDTVSFIGIARYFLDKDHSVSAYLMDRRDRSNADFSPYHFGIRSWGRPGRGLRHWVELSRADGVDGPERIDGYGVDLGLSYVFDGELRPTVTFGWALGTGDDDLTDRRGPFRQTGLQDNNGKFGGVTSFRYYGELFDPELSNLQVTTLGFGIRPARNFSVDVIGHVYRQDELVVGSDDERAESGPERALEGTGKRARSCGRLSSPEEVRFRDRGGSLRSWRRFR